MQQKEVYMPVKDYAEKKGITVQAVYKMITEKKIKTKKIGSYTLVSA